MKVFSSEPLVCVIVKSLLYTGDTVDIVDSKMLITSFKFMEVVEVWTVLVVSTKNTYLQCGGPTLVTYDLLW